MATSTEFEPSMWTDFWTTRSGEKVLIMEMHPRHAANALKKLRSQYGDRYEHTRTVNLLKRRARGETDMTEAQRYIELTAMKAKALVAALEEAGIKGDVLELAKTLNSTAWFARVYSKNQFKEQWSIHASLITERETATS